MVGRAVADARLEAGHAADVLWPLTAFDSFDLLYSGRGASVDEAADLLVTTPERALCA